MGDRALMTSTLVLSSVPYYIVALLISLYFTIIYPILPRSGYTPLTENPGKWFAGLLTPWLVLGIYSCTQYARFSRGSMVETLSEDFIRTARAKGLSDRVVTYKHALRSGLIPVVTIFGLDIAGSLAGAIFTERIFDLPGIGKPGDRQPQQLRPAGDHGHSPDRCGVPGRLELPCRHRYSLIDPRVRLA